MIDLFNRGRYKRANKKIGFTLAEVLITIGIIGVVSALTIPTLISNYQKKQTATLLKKTYADLKNIIRLSTVDNEEPSGWKYPVGSNWVDCQNFIKTYYLPYAKGANLLDTGFQNIKTLNGSFIQHMPACGFETQDGRIISLFPNTNSGYIWLYADINGKQGPNRVGRDIFVFDAYNYASTDYDIRIWLNIKSNPTSNFYASSGYGCSKENDSIYAGFACGAIIQRNNWEIPNDYPW
ncbi:type II secretion system protein [bacterium]|nr:type II secretion system protein [bacterium]